MEHWIVIYHEYNILCTHYNTHIFYYGWCVTDAQGVTLKICSTAFI